MTTYYKWTVDRGPLYGRGDYVFYRPQPRIGDALDAALHGYHYVTRDQLPYAVGTELWAIDHIEPPEVVTQQACFGRTFQFVRRMAWSRADLLDFAQWCVARHPQTAWDIDDMRGLLRFVQSDRPCSSQELSDHVTSIAERLAAAAICSDPYSSMDARYLAERQLQADWIIDRLRENGEDI